MRKPLKISTILFLAIAFGLSYWGQKKYKLYLLNKQMTTVDSLKKEYTTTWDTLVPSGANFRITFPNTPQNKSTVLQTDNGWIDVTQYSLNTHYHNNYLFSVGMNIYPEKLFHCDSLDVKEIDAFVKKIVDSKVEGCNGNIVYHKRMYRDTIFEYKTLIQFQDSLFLKCKMYPYDNRMYFVQTLSSDKKNEEIDQFFDSFSIH